MVAASLVACTSDSDKNAPPNPPPEPNPGQVVIIAGAPDLRRNPRDGEYAVRTNANGTGGLAVAPDGSIYFPASIPSEFPPRHRLARITKDGRLHLLPIETEAEHLAISGDKLWLMTSDGKGVRLEAMTLGSYQRSVYLNGLGGRGQRPVFVDGHNRPLPSDQQSRLLSTWDDTRFGLRAGGAPVIVTRKGDLFEVLGNGKVRRWIPRNYASLLRKATGGGEFQLVDVGYDRSGSLAILGTKGLVHLPAGGTAISARFPKKHPELRWTRTVLLRDGSVVLLGSERVRMDLLPPALVTPAGKLIKLNWGKFIGCRDFDGSLAAIRSANPGQITPHPDGYYVLADRGCGMIYGFRLPSRMAGTPFSS